MSSRVFLGNNQYDFVSRKESAVTTGGASDPEPRTENQDYPFICGYSMWSGDEESIRP